jgi:hypothetical protein
LSVVIDFPWEFDFTGLNIFVESDNVVAEEGGLSEKKFVNNDPKSKVVTLGPNSVFFQHLRRQVSRTAAESFGKIVLCFFAESKIH